MALSFEWTPVPDIADPCARVEARLQAHYACQWPSRLARAVLEARDDDSHTNLGCDAPGTLMAHPLPVGSGTVTVGLDVPAMTIMFARDGQPGPSLALAGHEDSSVRAWMLRTAHDLGIDPADLPDRLPYDLPPHALTGGGTYRSEGLEASLHELSLWFSNGTVLFQAVTEAFGHIDPGPTSARVWPHHFDLGMLIVLEEGDPEHARTIGLGLSPGDELFSEPYFYVNPYPAAAGSALPALDAGTWYTQGFTGAILKASDIQSASDQEQTVRAYVESAVDAAFGLLT